MEKKRKLENEVDASTTTEADGSADEQVEREPSSQMVKGVKTDEGFAWQLGNKKVLQVRKFKGRTLV